MLDAWRSEPRTHDETRWTAWAREGYRAWNVMSPELEFCEFAAALVGLIQPRLVVETGVGQGYVTRRVAGALPQDGRLLCFESDPDLRREVAALAFFATERIILSDAPSPLDLSEADLCIFDSGWTQRIAEVRLWVEQAPRGGWLLVHDTGNGHPPRSGHARMRRAIQRAGIDGLDLPNPRGGLLACRR